MLRFMTCGAVDNGKSTLLGRILHDAKVILKDQAVDDLAHLFDGLQAEREKGITIDVAYGFFRTAKKRFRMADAPGHEEFLPNMATAASQVDCALLLIDAKQGISIQTKRHAQVLDFMGVPLCVVCVNKMDLCDFSKERFDQICEEFKNFGYKFETIFIPIVAKSGDNVVHFGQMEWYQGKPLLSILETLNPLSTQRTGAWSVQYKTDNTYFGLPHHFSVGDTVFTKSGQTTTVYADHTGGMRIGSDIDLDRGDIVSTVPLRPLEKFYVHVLGFKSLTANTPYLIQFQHKIIQGTLKDTVAYNEFQKTWLWLDASIVWQNYGLVIDKDTYETVGILRIEPSILWFTGRSGSGKTTLAKYLVAKRDDALLLDADQVRTCVNCDLGLDASDRVENVRRIADMAYLLANTGHVVCVACIAPYQEQRERLKTMLPMAEIFVDAPLRICQERDPKGLYTMGITSPYEDPIQPDFRLDTVLHDVATCIDNFTSSLKGRRNKNPF